MQLSEKAVCKINSEGGFVFEAKEENRLRILGASMPRSGMRDVPVSFASFSIAKEQKEGLIVLTVIGGRLEHSFAVHVTWRDDKLIVDLDKRFVPRPWRLLQVTQIDGIDSRPPRIEATLENGVIAVSKDRYSVSVYTVCDPERNYLVVPDGDLLARYLIGQAELADLVKFAAEWSVEAPARVTLAQAKRELEDKKSALITAERKLADAEMELKQLRKPSMRRW